ncbi:hypothetical protein GCM10027614_04290 [Micromonospora vulcania]
MPEQWLHPGGRGTLDADLHLRQGPGFRPQIEEGGSPFTAVVKIEPDGVGTKYTANAIHGDAIHGDAAAKKSPRRSASTRAGARRWTNWWTS